MIDPDRPEPLPGPADLAAPDAALAAALEGRGGMADGELLTLDEVAAAADVVPAVVEALVREGLLEPRATNPDRWAPGDATAVRDGLRLVEAGVPLGELLDLARRTNEGLRDVAAQAVDTFLRFVRDPVLASAGPDEDAAQKLVEAFEVMLPATSRLMATHFERLVVEAARERILDEAKQA